MCNKPRENIKSCSSSPRNKSTYIKINKLKKLKLPWSTFLLKITQKYNNSKFFADL